MQTREANNTKQNGAGHLRLAVVLFVLWLLGFAVFHVAGGLIHLLLVVAVIVVLLRIIEGRPVV